MTGLRSSYLRKLKKKCIAACIAMDKKRLNHSIVQIDAGTFIGMVALFVVVSEDDREEAEGEDEHKKDERKKRSKQKRATTSQNHQKLSRILLTKKSKIKP